MWFLLDYVQLRGIQVSETDVLLYVQCGLKMDRFQKFTVQQCNKRQFAFDFHGVHELKFGCLGSNFLAFMPKFLLLRSLLMPTSI